MMFLNARDLGSKALASRGLGDLDGYRAAQRAAFDAAAALELDLEAGTSEREASRSLADRLTAAGAIVHEVPRVWFGDRTAIGPSASPAEARPSHHRLELGAPVVVDVSIELQGYAASIAYAFAFGANAAMRRLLDDLAAARRLVPRLLREKKPIRAIVTALDRAATEQGAVSVHAGAPESSRRPSSGVLAVGPHWARDGVGAGFKELLVVTEDDAFWLDDAPPHVRRWIAREVPWPDAVRIEVS